MQLPTDERQAFLDQACAGDSRLREELDSLLKHAGNSGFLAQGIAAGAAGALEAAVLEAGGAGEVPDRLGPYALVGLIGSGGMGQVFRAEDSRLGRDVAIKILPMELAADAGRVARFKREARLLAAFGCLLYEMLTGASPFGRATLPDTLAAIVDQEPDWGALDGKTPPPIRSLVERCLRKDPRRRLRDIGDAWVEIDEAERATSGTMPAGVVAAEQNTAGLWRPRVATPWLAAAVVGGVVLGAAILHYATPRASPPVMRMSVDTQPPFVVQRVTRLDVVVNWFEELRRRVPANGRSSIVS